MDDDSAGEDAEANSRRDDSAAAFGDTSPLLAAVAADFDDVESGRFDGPSMTAALTAPEKSL